MLALALSNSYKKWFSVDHENKAPGLFSRIKLRDMNLSLQKTHQEKLSLSNTYFRAKNPNRSGFVKYASTSYSI